MAFYAAASANLHPELEKPGLLPQRPLSGSLYENGSSVLDAHAQSSSRRPADVYIPRWWAGPPAAWDFAVTSGLRADKLRASALDGSVAESHYEGFKRGYLGTKDLCQAEGMAFIPMIIEAVGGGWGSEAAKVWAELAKTIALATGEPRAIISSRLLQSLAIRLHRENARAILRRSPRALDPAFVSSASAVLAGEVDAA